MIKILILSALLTLYTQYEKSDRILFVGDSMTAYKGGWQHQLAKKLGYSYDNLSVSGKRTDWMLRTLTEHLKMKSDYKICVIYGGINDGFAYVKTRLALENVQKMVDLCNLAGIKPIVIMGYDPNKVMVNLPKPIEKLEFHRNRYIEIQKLLLTELKDCKIVPIDQDISRADSDDGVHFVASGHRKLAEWVYKNY